MLRLDLQFYAFFVIVLCGAALGLLFDLLRAARGHYEPNRWVAALADLLFWAVATVALSGALFFGNWGELRFYVAVALLAGAGLYFWLASQVISGLFRLVFWLLGWLANLVAMLVLKLVWNPLVFLAGLVWGGALVLWSWTVGLTLWVVGLLNGLSYWLCKPLIRPYRCLKLRYLLAKRRLKRWLRRVLLGDGKPRRRR